MSNQLGGLRQQLKKANERLDIIRGRKAEYVLAEDVPLQLVKNERQITDMVAQLSQAVRAAEDEQLRRVTTGVVNGGQKLLAAVPPHAPARPHVRALVERLLTNLRILEMRRDDRQSERTALLDLLDKVTQQVCHTSFERLCEVGGALLGTPLATPPDKTVSPAALSEQMQNQSVRTGIGALVDLTQDMRVREIVGAFNADFAVAREGVRELAFFKDLHDQLHTLQYKCYNPIVRDARNFPADPTVHVSLRDYEMTVREIIRALHDIVERAIPPVPSTDWFADLEKSSLHLREALDTSSPQRLKLAILQIDRVLSTQPVYINANLIARARSLPLGGLVATMDLLQTHLAGLELDPLKLSQLGDGITALSTISQAFSQLLVEHDAWQTIERDMRRIEISLRQDTLELEVFWDDLKAKVTRLCQGCVAEWAESLRADQQRLENALKAHEAQLITEAFLRYRRQAGDRFFRVDTDLKRQCDRLREFDDPFANLLRASNSFHARHV